MKDSFRYFVAMSSRRHFHTFDAFRFFAFLLVFLTHVPLGFAGLDYIGSSGGIGVQFFFVLSGFLITYIIAFEKKQKGNFSFKRFIIRRMLRIWPLFYAMIAFAFITPYLLSWLGLPYSNEGYEPNWLMSCLFLENYKMMFEGVAPNVSPLVVMWSLCIEEHFYLFWGIILYFLPLRHLPVFILCSILIANISRIIFDQHGLDFSDLLTNLDFFAYGAIPAWLVIKKHHLIKKLNALPGFAKYLFAGLVLLYIFVAPNLNYPGQVFIDPAILGLLFTGLILFTLPLENSLFIHENHIISRLGIYTYGLYLFHTIVINLFLQVFGRIGWNPNEWRFGILFFVLSLGVTILVSMISYHVFEKQFLKLKKRFY